MIVGDQVRVTVFVAVAPAEAFRAFTEEIDLWWGKGPRFRITSHGPSAITFEPSLGGRLLERVDTPGGPQLVEKGRITAWEPPSRFVFDWRGINFLPDEKTEVEVRFTAAEDGTNVEVCHRGWSKLPASHPVRHGQDVPAFIGMLGSWWGALMSSLREHTAL
jgi:uncharacterized protein YndB with AHSA1/START domain